MFNKLNTQNNNNENEKEDKKELTQEEIQSKVEAMNLSELYKDDEEENNKRKTIKPVHWIICGLVFIILFYILERMNLVILQAQSPYLMETPKGIGLFPYMITHSPFMSLLVFAISLGVAAFVMSKMISPKERNEDRMTISKVGILGTTNWMDSKEINDRFNLCPVDNLDGIPIGVRFGKAICIPWEPKSLNTSLPNNNILVTGPAGTRKSRGLIIPHSIQYIKHGSSLIVTDTKGDLYRKLAPIADHYGYEVKKFICQSERFQFSDGWDCLKTVRESSDPLAAAIMFANVVITNTEDPKSNNPQFWRNQDENLLSALVLYVALSSAWVPLTQRKVAKRDLKEVYALLSTSIADIEQIFENIKIMNPKELCIGPYDRWHDNAQYEQSFSNLATRLRMLQNDYISGMLSADEIDIKDAGRKKTVIFVIMDDMDSTYQFVSSLFFSFAFYELVKLADSGSQVLDVPVQFMLDEFPNCGAIPDFTRKISTVRSRGIGITICIQGLNQLKLLYPNNEWENILNNCAVQIVLGAYENTTSKYYSDMIGDCTVVVENQARDFATFSLSRMLGYARDVKITKSNVQRKLLKPEEIIGMEIDRQIVKIAGTTRILEEHKYDMSMHPDSKITADIKHTEGTPQWVIDDGLDINGSYQQPMQSDMPETIEKVDTQTGEILDSKPQSSGVNSILAQAKQDRANEKELEMFKANGLNNFEEPVVSEESSEEKNVNDSINDNYFLDELTDDFFEEFDDDSGLL